MSFDPSTNSKVNALWPIERIDRLSALWAKLGDNGKPAHSAAAIGAWMGCSKNSVIGKVRRLGLPSRPSPLGPQGAAALRLAGRPLVVRHVPVTDGATLPPLADRQRCGDGLLAGHATGRVGMSGQQLPLFAPEMVPETAVPVPEWSPDWVVARILRATEDVLFNPDKLAKYEAKNPDGRAFLEFLVENCGGRSQ